MASRLLKCSRSKPAKLTKKRTILVKTTRDWPKSIKRRGRKVDQNVCLLVDYSQEMKCKSNVFFHTTPELTKRMCGTFFFQLTDKLDTSSTQEHIVGSLFSELRN